MNFLPGIPRLLRHDIFDDVDDDDDDEVLDILLRRPRKIEIRIDFFNKYDDYDFARRFRLTKEVTMFLLGQIEERISPPSLRNDAVPALNRLLIVLRYYATGSYYLVMGDLSGVSESSVCNYVGLVTEAIVDLLPTYIFMPRTIAEIQEKQRGFYELARFPTCVGTIDCTHVEIKNPGGENAEYFRNRKNYFSINVQTISDAQLRIMNIVARWPGSTHDQRIFDNSQVRADFENGRFGEASLIGDSGYANREYLVTPLVDIETAAEERYNSSVLTTRNTVERQYGVWKNRFPVVGGEIRLQLDRVCNVILATAVLHNICVDMDLPLPDEVRGDPRRCDPVGVPNRNQGNDGMRRRLIQQYFATLPN